MLRIFGRKTFMYQSFKGGLGGIALAKHGRKSCNQLQRIHMEKKVKVEWQRAIWDRPEKEVPA